MKRSTKSSLMMSAIALLLCVSMLIGTTFAWFTDSVTSTNNIIASGTLDVSLEWMYGTEEPANKDSSDWKDGSDVAIFSNTLWEPGYTEVRHVKIENEGTLSLKYKVEIIPDGDVSDLSDVIDVYYIDPAMKLLDRDELPEANKLGTLTQALHGMAVSANGTLLAGADDTVTIALKMQETAGNDYQNKSIGTSFNIRVYATQLTYEEDSFDDQYDANSSYPVSTVAELMERLATAEAGDSIFLNPGEYELTETLSIPSGVSLYGAQVNKPAVSWVNDPNAEKTIITGNGTSASVIEMIQTSEDASEAVSNITINGILIDCENTAGKGIYTNKTDGEALEGIKVLNCAVINATNNAIDIKNAYGAVIENNYIENVKDSAIVLGNYNGYHYVTWDKATAYVSNNVIKNVYASANGAITVREGMGDVVVSGNVIDNVVTVGTVGSSSEKGSAISVYNVSEGGFVTVENNTITNAAQGISVYKYTYGVYYNEDWWEGPTTNNDGLTIKNNKVSDFTTFGISVTNLNKESAANTATVQVLDNELVSSDTANALVVGNQGSNWTLTAAGNTLNGVESSDVNRVVTK